MSATILDGKKLAQEIRNKIKEDIAASGLKCGLAVILVGSNPASQIYVKNKVKACEEVGIKSYGYYLNEDITEEELLTLIDTLNNDKNVNGILVQLPLPFHFSEKRVLEAINPLKDVDGFSAINAGKLMIGDKSALLPCTPSGVMELIRLSGIDIKGKNAVVVGRSNIVGKPVSLMLLAQDATVTITHSKTTDLASITKTADILVAAVGKPKMITASMVKKGAIVIDVGINRVDGKVVGDVDYDSVAEVASYITPVPGGVGPMTIAMLLHNTYLAAQNQK